MKVPVDQFDDWLKSKNLVKRTREQYIYYLLKFLPNPRFDQESVSKFMAKDSNRNIVARSFIKNFQKFLMIHYKELKISPEYRIDISDVEIPELTGRRKQKIFNPLSEEQIWKLEKYFKEEKDKLMLLCSFYGGLRIGELLKIQIVSFNWEAWKKDMSKFGECKVYGKGNKEGTAFFPPWLMKRIARFIHKKEFTSPSSYIFLRKIDNLENINLEFRKKYWNNHLQQAGLKSGITKKNSEGKIIKETSVHPHRLRHSYGHWLRTVRKLDIRDIQELLRHTSIKNTEIYTVADKGHIRSILDEKVSTLNPDSN